MRKCGRCKKEYPKTDKFFYKTKRKNYGGFGYWCKTCCSIEGKKIREKWKAQGICIVCGKKPAQPKSSICSGCLKRHRKNNLKLKIETLEYYGGLICNCCGETHLEFLTIDHVDGGGNKHRKSIGSRGGLSFYTWLRKNNYPEGYQVLCQNCNHAMGHYGFCPHDKSSRFVVTKR